MRLTNQNTILITLQDWQAAGLTYDQFRWQVRKNQVEATRACKGKPAEINLDSIPSTYRSVIVQRLGDPRQNAVHQTFRDLITTDDMAVTFYSSYLLSDGRNLSGEHIREYCANANVLNAVKTMFKTQNAARKPLGGNMQGFWTKALNAVETVRGELQHTLPSNEVALKRKYLKYESDGYQALISGKFCNDNSRKVSADIERLIMSMYIMPEKPFAEGVHILYKLFLSGSIQVVDSKTGELFRPEDFIKNGAPVEISEKTVWNYLNQPKNRVIVDSKRSGQFNFNNEHRPHHHRNAPNFSFSKISMDDRDLPRKLNDGKRVKAYYAYDVASGCVIGKAYSRSKDEALFIDCMQDMFRMIDRENLGMPLEVEVENHLVNKFFDDLAVMFPFIRICKPGNSQEKHAEHLNKAKKYGVEKKLHAGVGRWYLSEAYRVDADKVNDEFVEKTFSFERLVADDVHACNVFNNSLHPKQKKYPGKTRWQVLLENINPRVAQVPKAVAYKAFGSMTRTSVVRNQYVTVRDNKYALPNPEVIDRLQYNNYEVEAYYLPDTLGNISEVYLYQNNAYLCTCAIIETYSTAKAEREEADDNAYLKQSAYVSRFDKMTKEGRADLATLTIQKTEVVKAAIEQPVTIVPPAEKRERSIEDILRDYNPDDYRNQANDQI